MNDDDIRRGDKPDPKMDPRDFPRPEEILQLMDRSMSFIKELMEENEKLRYRMVQLQEENRSLFAATGRGGRAEVLKRQITELELEKNRLLSEYQGVEENNKTYAARYVEIEEENNNLTNLYVCSFQLHSTLDFDEVIQIIMEIVINLIGAEDFGIMLLDEKTYTLKTVAMEGMSKEEVGDVRVGEGIIGKTFKSGENYFDPSIETALINQKRPPGNPLVCIPLKIKESVIGVIVLYKLLPQKTQFAHVDYELFTLLAGHAATAIFSTKLYSDARRKLETIEGFMEMLKSTK